MTRWLFSLTLSHYNIKKCVDTTNMGGRTYPVAMRLRDRKGRAILCIALNPQSGDFSGAILGVRSVALLHSGIGEDIREVKETAILRIVLFNNYNNRIPMWRCDWILFLP